MDETIKKEANLSLVATLGGQPQVVTFTLDLLLARGEPVNQVILIFPGGDDRYRRAYQRLAQEFQGDMYRGRPCRLRRVDVAREGRSLADLRAPSDVEAARRTIYALFADLKARGERLHLSLSGGRRVLALTALSAAMQYLTPADRIWHIYTPAEIAAQARDGRMLHAPPESGVALIEVPFVPWTAYFPGLKSVLGLAPAAAGWLSDEDGQRCRALWGNLTPRERDALRALADGLSRKEAAADLGIAVATLDSHVKHILQKSRRVWGQEDISREFLREKFALFFARYDIV